MGGQFGWEVMQEGWRKGPWTAQEDKLLFEYIHLHGEGRWNFVSKITGLKRSGKSCRLRWVNYLRPDLKRGKITPHEERIIMQLHSRWGNRWSAIARTLPGRTDNEIKNYWRTHFKKAKPSKNLERERCVHHLRQQQQQQQHENPHEQPAKEYTAGIRNIVPQLEEEVASLAQGMQDLSFIYTPYAFQSDASFTDEASSDEGAWGCLWNLDGVEHAAAAAPDACGSDTSLQDQHDLFDMIGFK